MRRVRDIRFARQHATEERHRVPAFVRKFSDQQRDAVIAAGIEYGLTTRRIAVLAARGGLPGCTDRFDISHHYVGTLIKRERERRAGIARGMLPAPGERLNSTVQRMMTALEASIAAYERRLRAASGIGKRANVRKLPPAPNPAQLVAMARAGQEI